MAVASLGRFDELGMLFKGYGLTNGKAELAESKIQPLGVENE